MPFSIKALVVDDSRVMRNMVMQSLTKTGLADFEFVEAQDGADALDKFDPRQIEMAFVDWNMPTMTGIEFVRKVRALGDTENIPLVMVTSEKTMGKIQEALDEAGADGFIVKPFTVEELTVKLKKFIPKVERAKLQKLREERERAAAQVAEEPKGFFGRLFS